LFVLDLDGVDQATNDLAAGSEVGLVEAVANLIGEIVQLAEYRLQLLPLRSLLRRGRCVMFQSVQPLTSARDARFEFYFLQQAIFIRIDESADAALHGTDLFRELLDVDIWLGLVRQPRLELLAQRLRVLENGADVGPHRRVQAIQSNRTMLTDLVASEAERVHSGTAVVWVLRLVRIREPRNALAIPAITASATHNEPLQQVAWTRWLLPQSAGGAARGRQAARR
jgi:hypothetical protein